MLRVSSIQTLAGISLIVIGALTSPSAAAPEKDSQAAKPAAAGAAKEPAAAGAGTPQPAGTPGAGAEATAGASQAACKKAVGDLGASGLAGLKSLDDTERANLVRGTEATSVFTCLAVAHDNNSFCDPLPEPGKGTCGESVKLARELKKLPQGQEKAFVIHQLCLANNMDKVECATARDSMAARNADRCVELKSPSLRAFCGAIAGGDVAKCSELQGDERSLCEAYASDDPARCPKDSVDCQNITRTFAAVKKEGLAGAKDIDPAVVAIRKGKQACTPLLGALEKANCTEVVGAGQK